MNQEEKRYRTTSRILESDKKKETYLKSLEMIEKAANKNFNPDNDPKKRRVIKAYILISDMEPGIKWAWINFR